MFWIFSTQAKAVAQNNLCKIRLKPDSLADGETAPRQITKSWSEPVALLSGEWALDVMENCECTTASRTVDNLEGLR